MRFDPEFEREIIDPKGEYPSVGLRQLEEFACRILEQAPEASVTRTRDVIQLDLGDVNDIHGLTILVTAEAIELRFPSIEWTMGAYGPAETSSLWKRLKAEELDDDKLSEWLVKAKNARQKEFRECRFCHKWFPPDYLHNKNTCHVCAEKHMGIVH